MINALGNSTVESKIKSVTKMKRRRRNLIVCGDMTLKQPLRKEKKVNKCIIYNIDEDAYTYFVDFFSK